MLSFKIPIAYFSLSGRDNQGKIIFLHFEMNFFTKNCHFINIKSLSCAIMKVSTAFQKLYLHSILYCFIAHY